MSHTHRQLRALLVTAAIGAAATVVTPAAATAQARPTSYELAGDAASPVGSKFEGIGADERRGLFYVSEVTGGEIHRGSVHSSQTVEVLAMIPRST